MADTFFRGPLGTLGAMIGPQSSSEAYDGPCPFYQGTSVLDYRFFPANKDGMAAARIPTFVNSGACITVDQIPQTTTTANIVAAAHTTSGTAMTLVTASPGGTVVSTYYSAQCPAIVPLIPTAASSPSFPAMGTPVNVLALDFGFAVGTTTSGSAVIASVPDTTLFPVGLWIVVGGAGNSANTLALVAQVLSTTASTVTMSVAAAGSLAAAPIGTANFHGTFPAQAVANAAQPYAGAGVTAAFNPFESLCRGLSVTCSSASGVGGAILVKGYDVFGVPMSESITITPASATVAYGIKAWKYISSVTPQFTDSGFNYSVGISDVFGFALASDRWESMSIEWAGGVVNTNSGWVGRLRTASNTTSADVRGTFQASTAGGGTNFGTNASNNSRRLHIQITLPVFTMVKSTPNNTNLMFGVPQA